MRGKGNIQLSEESSEKTIDSLPRRYPTGTLASSSTTPCALHGNTTSLHVHVVNVGVDQSAKVSEEEKHGTLERT
jgi:hypothetical protein